MSHEDKIVLAIESAIGGGSLSLIRNGHEIAGWTGTSGVAKAEALLANIDSVLSSQKLDAGELDAVTVGAGPGSFTGIRVGIATALGLSRSLNIDLKIYSALRAMSLATARQEEMIVAIPMGRKAVCMQYFDRRNLKSEQLSEPVTAPEVTFFDRIKKETGKTILLHTSLYERVSGPISVVNFGRNVAFAIGRMYGNGGPVQHKPLFISKSFR